MENNKLIAEFMGDIPKYVIGHGKAYNKYKDYSKSWDWLMPVISKIETVGRGWFPHELHTSLMKNDIDNAYDTVVEFINEHNKYICGSCGDHVNEVVFNEDTDVDECKNCIQ